MHPASTPPQASRIKHLWTAPPTGVPSPDISSPAMASDGSTEMTEDFLRYRGGVLCMEGRPLPELVRSLGTPFFLLGPMIPEGERVEGLH